MISVSKKTARKLGLEAGPERSKYNVNLTKSGKLSRTLDGICYDSVAEMQYAAELNIKKRAKLISGYERQICFEILINGKKICSMVVDFVVHYLDSGAAHDRTEIVEVKGAVTREYTIKRKLFEALNPTVYYRVISSDPRKRNS